MWRGGQVKEEVNVEDSILMDKTVELIYTKYMKVLIMRKSRKLSNLCSTRTHIVRFC